MFFINACRWCAAVLAIIHPPRARVAATLGDRARSMSVAPALAVVFLASLTYGLIEGPTRGWTSAAVLACLVAAGVSGPAFLYYEHRRRNPLLRLSLFASRQFSAANAVTFLVYRRSPGGAFFLLPVLPADGGRLHPRSSPDWLSSR